MLSPKFHIRLGWDTNAAAATMAMERLEQDGVLPGHKLE